MPDDEVLTQARARIGKVLRGKYRLDRVLGVGGMAVVYAATHRNKKKFAIKMLHPELSMRENIRTRFLREGYVANSVEHPGAVAVLDDDIAEDGAAFVVMELLDGAPVDEVWARYGKRVPLSVVLSIGDALLDVLAAAHAKGVVHRDIKPANVFLTSDGRLEVLDFGIARLHDETSSATTQTGAMMGTPAYMAPEQALADTAKVDAQTDLWAVGATLFSLLTGELVHPGENASQLLVNAATKKAREISSVAEEVPKKIGEVIDKALAFEKKDRWASAKEMREALAKACVDVTGGPIAPLPKIERAPERMTGLEPTMTPPLSSTPGSSKEAFDRTVNASDAANGRGVPGLSTRGALSKSLGEHAPRAVPWRTIGAGVLACAVLAGGAAAYRAGHAPRIRYCLSSLPTKDGMQCGFEVGKEAIGKAWMTILRVTEQGGHVVLVECINSAGFVDDRMTGLARIEVVRDDSGAVREQITFDRFGSKVGWEKWSEGGTRVDYVDDDGKTPRTSSRQDAATTERREYDAEGRLTRLLSFGPTGRPRKDKSGAYGIEMEQGKTPGVRTKETVLGSDGSAAPGDDGIVFTRRVDDSTPFGQVSYFDANDRPAYRDGYSTLHIPHDEYELTGFTFLGPAGEPLSTFEQTVHEARNTWDPSKRTYDQRVFDDHGRPQVVRGLWCVAIHETYDSHGRAALVEFLDGEGNRVVAKNGASAERYQYDDLDREVVTEELDPSGALMPGAEGFARRETKRDARNNPIERRYYDEAGHLAASKTGGAIERLTFDERNLQLSSATFDASDSAVANVHGFASVHDKYDRMRNLVEVAYLGADGRPVASDEGFAMKRLAYDENDDLVSISYFDGSGAPTLFESSYATQRLKHDERGLVVEEEYTFHGDPVVVKDGYASVKTTRDRNGDAIGEAYFGKHGEPVLREGGYARKKTTFDVTRRPTEVELFDVAGQPVRGKAGWVIERTTYDPRGLVLRIDHLDATSTPALDQEGRASVTKTWDPRANETEETTLDAAGTPVVALDGYATKRMKYDDRDELLEEELLGAEGKPASGKAGWSLRRVRYDDFGDVVDESFFDVAHEPTIPEGLTYSSTKQRFDARHRLAEVAYFDVTGAPAKGPDGVAVVRYQRDGYGRITESAYFDGTGNPVASKDGKIVARSRYDAAGRPVDERSLDASGAPHAAADGCSGHHSKYDPQGRKLEESCLDAKDAPTLSADGWAIRRTLHDAHGNDVDVATYAPDGTLHADKDGVARRKRRFDERNVLVETTLFDANEKLVHDKHGSPPR